MASAADWETTTAITIMETRASWGWRGCGLLEWAPRGDVTSIDRLDAPTVPVIGQRSTGRSRIWPENALIVLSDTSQHRIQIHCKDSTPYALLQLVLRSSALHRNVSRSSPISFLAGPVASRPPISARSAAGLEHVMPEAPRLSTPPVFISFLLLLLLLLVFSSSFLSLHPLLFHPFFSYLHPLSSSFFHSFPTEHLSQWPPTLCRSPTGTWVFPSMLNFFFFFPT